MGFWIRELAGWLLVLLGLYLFLNAISQVLKPVQGVIAASYLTVIGIFVFRGGIHLLKVAVAARICLQAQKRLDHSKTPPI
jgi:hypothetical protein